jgi:hypothetical protein
VAWNLVLYQGRDAALAEFKVRLHGADPFHPEPGFIVGRDQSASSSHNTRTVENGRFLGSRLQGGKSARTPYTSLHFGSVPSTIAIWPPVAISRPGLRLACAGRPEDCGESTPVYGF